MGPRLLSITSVLFPSRCAICYRGDGRGRPQRPQSGEDRLRDRGPGPVRREIPRGPSRHRDHPANAVQVS